MKNLFAATFLLLMQYVSAQDVTKSLENFTTVKVFDKISVKLVKGNENKIVIKGSRAEDIYLVNEDNELKIRMKLSKLLQGEDVTATLYYKNITDVETSEGAYISSEDIFKTSSFILSAKEGSKIKLNLQTDALKTKINSGGEIELTGRAASHDVTITSGGILKAKSFTTGTTAVTINAGGSADIFVTETVDAKTRAGGSIDIYGKPKTVSKKSVAGGSITVR